MQRYELLSNNDASAKCQRTDRNRQRSSLNVEVKIGEAFVALTAYITE